MQLSDDALQLDNIHTLLDRLCPDDELDYLTARPWLYDTMAHYLHEQFQDDTTLHECRVAVVSYIQLQQAKRRKRMTPILAILGRSISV